MGVEPSDCNKLYIRLPVKIIDKLQIRALHKNIVEVRLPRQKSRRWCIVHFENKEKLQEAVAALKKLKIDNKSIVIRTFRTGPKKNKKPIKTSETSNKYRMGVTFIGNPFDQDEDYDDSDWDVNAVEEWIMPPQEVAFLDPVRVAIDLIPAPEVQSSDSDEDYIPDDDEEDFDDHEIDTFFYDSNEDEEEEDIDYVTFPIRDANDSEPEKPSTADAPNPDESSDTD